MAYAIDRKEIGDKLYHGLRYPANSPVPPSLPKFHNNNVGAYDKDVEKAKNYWMKLDIKIKIVTDSVKIQTEMNLNLTF